MDAHDDRAHDIVLFGATGSTGRLVAEHLATHAPPGLRIALAGRSPDRLAAVRADLPGVQDWPLVTVDAGDAPAVSRMARDARVVVTTVGPYARYGHDVAAACAAHGTDYADLTGEILFVRDTADRHHARAVESGARLVHACGFDSVPSDLSVWLAARAAAADDAGDLAWATLALRSIAVAVGGGTVETVRNQFRTIAEDPSTRRILGDPYALSPDRDAEPDLGRQSDVEGPGWDPHLGMWTAPFVMASFNTRIVRRSNALLGWAYGRRLRYREVVAYHDRWLGAARAVALTAGVVALVAAMRGRRSRAVLDRLLPAPGEGPDAEARANGHFAFDLHAGTERGARYRVRFAAQSEPAFSATAVMLGESALALAVDRDRLPATAGVLTPATGIGAVLVDRLRRADFDIRVERVT